MKNVKHLFLFLMMSCSSSKVIYDYDAKTDFSSFKTYQFYTDNGENLNDFDVKRITNAIDNVLRRKDFLEEDNPSFYIFFETETKELQNNNTIGIGIGSGSRNVGFGISGGIPIGGKKLNEELIIKFIEAKNNTTFWEGSFISTIKEKRTPRERELHLKTVVEKILSFYPPKK